jgi:hypothetical protein
VSVTKHCQWAATAGWAQRVHSSGRGSAFAPKCSNDSVPPFDLLEVRLKRLVEILSEAASRDTELVPYDAHK